MASDTASQLWPQVHRVNGWAPGAAALAYGAGGLRVFPLWGVRPLAEEAGGGWVCRCPSGVLPEGAGRCTEPGKHPLVAWKEGASSSESVIRAWWERWPWANVGLALPDGLLVLDLDQHERVDAATGVISVSDGEDSLKVWASECEPQVEVEGWYAVLAHTGGGGKHLFLSVTDAGGGGVEPERLKNRNGWLPGVDVKTSGGYVLVAPSQHVSGERYRWEEPAALGMPGGVPAEAPEVLVSALRTAGGSGAAGGGAGGGFAAEGYDYARFKLDGPPEGHRDYFFNSYAFELRRSGLSERVALARLRGCWEKIENKSSYTWELCKSKYDRVSEGGSDDVGVDEDKRPENVVALEGWVKGVSSSGSGSGSGSSAKGVSSSKIDRQNSRGSLALNPAPRLNVTFGELYTERSAAKRFINLNHEYHLKITSGDWFSWDHALSCWIPDPDGGSARTSGIERVIESYQADMHVSDNEREMDHLQKWLGRLGSRSVTTAVLKNAADDPEWRVEPELADSNPELFQTPGFVLVLKN